MAHLGDRLQFRLLAVRVELAGRTRGVPFQTRDQHDQDRQVDEEDLPEQPRRAHGLFLEAIADAADGLDVLSRPAQLAAQGDDMHVHGTLGDGIIVAMDRVQDLVAREHPAGFPCQRRTACGTPWRSAPRFPVDQNLMPAGMDRQIVDA